MRGFSRNESIIIAKLRKVNRENLEEKVKSYARIDDPSESDLEEYENAKAEAGLKKIYDHIAEGIILRSKSQWYEEGEKSSKYFLTLEKSRKAKTCNRNINSEEHGEACDPKSHNVRAKSVSPKFVQEENRGRMSEVSVRIKYS